MVRIATAVLFLVGASTANGQPFDPDNHEWLALGVYYCVTERIAGIQSGDRNDRFGGRIKVDEMWSKFTLQVSKRDRAPACRQNLTRSRNLRLSSLDLWFYCDAPYEVKFEGSIPMGPMHGESSNSFRGMLWEQFNIFNSGRFILFRSNDAGDFYLHEGRCQKFK